MAEFVKICKESDIKNGQTKALDVKGKRIAIINFNSKFYGIDALCTHAEGPLEDGEVKDFVVTCPWHGSQFDIRTGKVNLGPAIDSINIYEVKIENGEVFVLL